MRCRTKGTNNRVNEENVACAVRMEQSPALNHGYATTDLERIKSGARTFTQAVRQEKKLVSAQRRSVIAITFSISGNTDAREALPQPRRGRFKNNRVRVQCCRGYLPTNYFLKIKHRQTKEISRGTLPLCPCFPHLPNCRIYNRVEVVT